MVAGARVAAPMLRANMRLLPLLLLLLQAPISCPAALVKKPTSTHNFTVISDAYEPDGDFASISTTLAKSPTPTMDDVLSLQDSLISLANYAERLREPAEITDAEARYLRCWNQLKDALGATHQLTLAALSNYAPLLTKLGRAEDAEPLCREAFDARLGRLGLEHADTRLSAHLFGKESGKSEVFAKGGASHVEIRTRNTQLIIEAIVALGHLVDALRVQGRHAEAARLDEHHNGTGVARKALGERHPIALVYEAKLARLAHSLGDGEALEEVIDRMETALGTEHPQTLKYTGVLGKERDTTVYVSTDGRAVPAP
jgi:hypothetical protein